MLNARLNKIFQKDFINIFVFIIETNTINSIIMKFQIDFKTQKYNEDFIFIMNIINFKITNEIVFKDYKVFIIVEINKNQRLNKIVINKFV